MTAQTTAQTPQRAQQAAAAPRAAMTFYTPTPTQSENDQFAVQQMHGTLPRFPWYHKADGSPVDPQSYDVTVGAPTWP